jgi:opacity protein-like surface antigen
MKNTLLITAIATAFSGQAIAESAFEGFYGQIGAGYESTNVSNKSADVNNGERIFNQGKEMTADGIALVLGAGYNFAISDKFLIGIGGDWSTFNHATNVSTYTKADDSTNTTDINSKVSDRYSVFITPSYALDKDKLVYFKAGFSGQTVNSIIQSPEHDNFGQSAGKANLSGYVLGVGYKQVIAGGLYGFGEGNWYDYSKSKTNTALANNTVSSNPSAYTYTLTAGVGYNF